MPGGGTEKTFFVLCVRGNPSYGKNDFHDNGDGTITDRATGLMWSKADSGQGMNWQDALAWVQKKNAEKFLGHDDWRLPSVKELQSIVDYTRSPDTTHSPAIDPIFNCTTITNEAHQADYPFYWSATTHAGFMGGGAAMYVAFGRAAGWMSPRGMAGGPPGPTRRFWTRSRSGDPVRTVRRVAGPATDRAVPATTTMLTSTAPAPNAAIPRPATPPCSRMAAARRAMSSAFTTMSASCASGRTEPSERRSTVESRPWFISLSAAALLSTMFSAATLDFDRALS